MSSDHFSVDRHVDSDTIFTRGRWELKQGIKVRWATENVKSVVKENELYSVYSTKPINHRGDTLNNGIITTRLSGAGDDIVKLEAYHDKSAYNHAKEPRFEVNTTPATATVEAVTGTAATNEASATGYTVKSGNLSAKIDEKFFGMEFSGDKPLTKLGFRSVGYVEDSRFPKPGLTGHTHQDYVTMQLHLSVGEKLYGLGERYGAFVKNGQHIEMWNEDGGTASNVTYKNVPFYMSNRGYGVFVDSTSNVSFDLQNECTNRVNIVVMGQGMRLYLIYGPTPKEILAKYASLTGLPALPPAWTFGLWLSTSFLTDYDYDTVSKFITGMKSRDIPLTVFHFDCFWMKGFQWCDFKFDPKYFPDAKKMLGDLKTNFGVKICVWINSYIGQESDLFDECDSQGYFIKKSDGASYQCDLWQGGMGIIDFTNPEAYKWFQSKLAQLVDLGVDCFKTDFGERIPSRDVTYHDGTNPVGMHNYYTYLYNKCVFEVLQEKKGEDEACLFARSTTAGGQKFPVHWGGDCESTFEAMAESLRGGLSLSLCGFGFWSHDIGGFEGSPHPAVYKRWCAFGLLSSHSRLHGSHSYRVPWNFDDESSVVLQKFTKLKLSLMPYIFGAAVEASRSATPVMRPMVLEFPDDKIAQTCDGQFMLGDCLMVAPVFSAEGDVSFYLPKGKWYGLLDGKVRDSQGKGEWFDEVHDFKSLPLLVRPNSVFISSTTDTSTPVYDYHKDYIVNIYAVEGTKSVDIPDTSGKIVATVTVTSTASGYSIDAPGNFSVKVLGQDVKESIDGIVGSSPSVVEFA
ncbi:putative alpha-xylosidase [[Candida] jaroonii]|uniref:Alpha-xylosidase n=1 Tax=[Candida] jaroonii TaxID=467808 RepID=A0ACA9YGI7_9ASCO|nr:putative alpha-xylosidase [[Candida] jaroonii]